MCFPAVKTILIGSLCVQVVPTCQQEQTKGGRLGGGRINLCFYCCLLTSLKLPCGCGMTLKCETSRLQIWRHVASHHVSISGACLNLHVKKQGQMMNYIFVRCDRSCSFGEHWGQTETCLIERIIFLIKAWIDQNVVGRWTLVNLERLTHRILCSL